MYRESPSVTFTNKNQAAELIQSLINHKRVKNCCHLTIGCSNKLLYLRQNIAIVDNNYEDDSLVYYPSCQKNSFESFNCEGDNTVNKPDLMLPQCPSSCTFYQSASKVKVIYP